MNGTNTDKSADAPFSWAGLLASIGKTLLPVLLTAGSLIGFVAFAGAVIEWTRFAAAKVPPDQAVSVVPQDELIAIGSSVLLVFGFFGALAVIGVYLIDRGGRVSPGMSRGLLLLVAVEGVAVVFLVEEESLESIALALELLLLPIAIVLWATFSEIFTQFDEPGLPSRARTKELPPLPRAGAFRARQDGETAPVSERTIARIVAWCVVTALVAGFVAGVAGGVDARLVAVIGLGVLMLTLFGALLACVYRFHRDPARATERWEVKEEEGDARRKPPRLELTTRGVALVAIMTALAAVAPSLLLGRLWLAASLGSAILLGAALWRIAALAAPRFMWYGIAVFLSVPLLGTLTALARNIDDPQVQPVALIRDSDGPEEAIQGLLVSEAHDRIYFATVATEGCSNSLTAHSGRLLWVPKSEVVAMAIGPLQDVDDAAGTALEMAYALTPGIDARATDDATLAVAGDSSTADPGAGERSLDKRLENVGPAVRPNFGAGLSLVPDHASPGAKVTLRLSVPNPDVEGFGVKPEGRTLRLGGIPVAILRERSRDAWEAEYVKSKAGLLTLDKHGLYEETNPDEFRLADPADGIDRQLFVRLDDKSVIAVDGEAVNQAGDRGGYLAIVPGSSPARLEEGQEVELRKGGRRLLHPSLLRQAWHEDHISFRVPDDASSGAVTVDCGQLAGQPLLGVTHKPAVRISVRMRTGTNRVSFDSNASTDEDGESLSRRWNVAGLRRGDRKTVVADLPPRLGAYLVTLTVTDESGMAAKAQLRLLRLPSSLFGFGEDEPRRPRAVARARRALMRVVRVDPPVAIELDGHADDPGSRRANVRLSLRRAERVRAELMRAKRMSGKSDPHGVARVKIPVRTLAYGEECPVDPRPGRRPRNRRVDVAVLDRGVTVVPAPECHPRRFESSDWDLRRSAVRCTKDDRGGESAPVGTAGILAGAEEVLGVLFDATTSVPARTSC